MTRPRKHIHRPGPVEAVAAGGQALYVPGEGGGVAGDVGDAGDACGGEGVQQRLVAALARRVEYGGVEALTAIEQPGDLPGGVAADEVGALREAVAFGVAAGVVDGGRHDLDAGGVPRPPRRRQRDGARAAVGVQHPRRAALGKARGPQRLAVEDLGLVRVDLEEGLGRDLKFEAAQPLRQRRQAVDALAAPVQRVGGAAVQMAQVQRLQFGQIGAQGGGEAAQRVPDRRVGAEDQHHFARAVHPGHQIAQVPGPLEAAQPFGQPAQRAHALGPLQQAVVQRDDVVPASGEGTDHGNAFLYRDGVFRLVAGALRVGAAQGLQYVWRFYAADAAQGV